MHKSNQLAYANLIQLSVDIIFLIITYFLAYATSFYLTSLQGATEYLWVIVLFIPLWVSIMTFRGMYDRRTFYYIDRIFRNVILAAVFSGLSLGAMFFFIKETNTSRLLIGIFIVYCIGLMFLERLAFSIIYQKSYANFYKPRIILVCSQETGLKFQQYLSKTQIRYHIVGSILIDSGKELKDVHNLGCLEDLGEILKKQVVDEVVFAMPKDYVGHIENYVILCEQMGLTVHLIMNFFDLRLSHARISMLGPLPLLTFNTVTLNPVQKVLKRLMDIVGAVIGIIITLVIAVFLIPVIKLDSPGPAFFKQKRVGRNGRIFYIYKFRTMCNGAESQKGELLAQNEHSSTLMFKIREDPRITRIGAFLRKTSIDEFPQFFNVLIGDMSLVGTRPPTLDEVEQYNFEHWRRISIKLGLTGMWQISGRSKIMDFNKVVELDTWYIDQWSIRLDIYIIFKTISDVVKMKSAF